jgi:type IX secretion system PorP/SprF family membrane protein
MKHYSITLTFALAVISLSGPLMAQPRFQDEQGKLTYRDYELLLNPASIGRIDGYFASMGVYKQWINMDGSPLSENLQFQMPLAESGGIGAWLYNESFTNQNTTQFGAAYSHKLRLGATGRLSFGLSLSMLLLTEDRISKLNTPDDPVFAKPLNNQFGFNAGFGVYYFTEKYYAGFSIPQLLSNDIKSGTADPELEHTFDVGRMQYYFTGGYRFDLSEKITLSPSVLLAVSGGAAFGYEGMLTASYDRRFEVGAGYAVNSCLQFSAGATIIKNLSLRYQFSLNLGDDYHKAGSSHFIVLRFNWGTRKT